MGTSLTEMLLFNMLFRSIPFKQNVLLENRAICFDMVVYN